MSRRHLLNLTTGGVVALLIGAILFAFSAGRNGDPEARVALTVDQQELVQEIVLDAAELSAAEDLPAVTRARTSLGENIYRFDVNLAALLDGGTATDRAGRGVDLDAAQGEARAALDAAAEVWLRVGLPLSDLAAGSFSAYSAAGRQAIAGYESGNVELARHLGAAANAMGTTGSRRSGLVGSAHGLSLFLALVLAGLIVLRRRGGDSDRAPAPMMMDVPAMDGQDVAPAMAPVASPVVHLAPPPTPQPYTAPVDLDNLSASVDRMGVDMQIISGSTDKMQQAIDSVGHALQGMLFSLNEMARDTEDGERVVRGSNSAAAYTAEVAAALVESVREMSRVVGNVTELANRTRQTASTLDAEAAASERTGRGFNLAVANEVRGLAAKTAASTASIESTVSDMLAKTREYEESIGQIIKHVTNINRVSQNLGAIMLDPPTADVVPAPAPPTQGPEPVAEPVAQAPTPFDDDATTEDFAAETAAAINEAAAVLEDTPAPEPEAAPEVPATFSLDEPSAPASEPTADAPPATFSLDDPAEAEATEPAAEEPEQKPAPFVLSRAREDEDAPAEAAEPVAEVDESVAAEPVPEPEPEPEPEAAAPEPQPEPEPEPVPEPIAEEPAAAAPEPEPAPAPPPPAPEEDDDSDEQAVSDGDSPNIFILNPPETADSEAGKVPAGSE